MSRFAARFVGALADGLDRGDADAAPAALLAEEAEVLLAVRRDLAQHRDALVAVALQPADDERGVAAAVAVAEAEAVLALEPLGAAPTDQRDLQLVRERADGDRVVGAVRAGDADAAFVDEVPEPVGRVLRRALRQPVLGVQHELDRPVEQSLLGRLVEREAVDLVVAAARTVERRAQPSDLDRFHTGSFGSTGCACAYCIHRVPWRAPSAGDRRDVTAEVGE